MPYRLALIGILSAGLLGSALLLSFSAAQNPAHEDVVRQVVLPGETRELLGRLRAADALLRKKAWADGIDEYLRLIDEAGDELVPELSPREQLFSTRRSVQLRRLCHTRIAALPPAALRHYRTRVDAQARRWLKQGVETHDIRALRSIVSEAFCSRFADQALDLLGDLAFERGAFVEARGWWQLVALPASEVVSGTAIGPGGLLFPDPQIDVARVRAKQAIALLFQGELRRAAAELQALRALHGQASGRLAGRTGNYATTLQSLLHERHKNGPLSPAEDDWPTFAGSPARNRVLEAALSPRMWTHGPAWRVRLDEPAAEQHAPRPVPARRLAFHPVIVGQRVLMGNARYLTGYDRHTGQRLFRYDAWAMGRPGFEALRQKTPTLPEGCSTLSVADGRVYARMGAQAFAADGKDVPGIMQPPSYLVCLVLPHGQAGKADAVKECWAVRAKGAAPGTYLFEGAPVVAGGRVYVAEVRWAGGRLMTAITCRNADKGTPRWRREVCEMPDTDEEPAARPRHQLLTLAGTAVVYCSHSGAVVSLDALTGRRLWGVRYPSRGMGVGAPRGPAPCVAVGRRLFVAPLDSDRLFCLDVDTGRTHWERTGMEAVVLLGVSEGRLIFTTARGCRALDAATGDDVGGWRQPAVGRLAAYGRGLLAGGWVLWPTQDPRLALRALNVINGRPQRGAETLDPTRLHLLRPGNMAFGGGCLVVADDAELLGYHCAGNRE